MHKELEKMLMDLAVKHDPKNKEYLKISPEIGMGAWQKLAIRLYEIIQQLILANHL